MLRNDNGQLSRRVEDYRLLSGQGNYTDDIADIDSVHAVFVRSPHAHASISSIDADKAIASQGVVAVFTAEDLEADNIGNIPCMHTVTGVGGSETIIPPNPLLASGRVLFAGDPVAMVVADSLGQAQDAAERVQVNYQQLAAVVETASALDRESVQIWPEAPGNLGVEWEIGDSTAVATAFSQATQTVKLTVTNNRIAVSPIEPRAAVASYDSESDVLTLTTPCQGVHGVQSQIADHVLKIPTNKLRILTPDVGGAFGARYFCNREQVLVAWAAKKFGRTVRWTASRTECFIVDGHGRDHINTGELALDSDGHFLALRVSTIANMGSHMKDWGPKIPTKISNQVVTGCYNIPTAHANIKCVFTNSVPIDAYRGTGRAESIYLLERLVDAASRQLDIAPDELRRRNLILPSEIPYHSASGQIYDSGNAQAMMQCAMERANWQQILQRKEQGLANGKLIGIGMSTWVMSASGLMDESARLRLDTDGGISAFVGTQPAGQGHATAYSQILIEHFDLTVDKIRIFQGDSLHCPPGSGTAQSRSLLMGGLAIHGAAKELKQKIAEAVGQLFSVDCPNITFVSGKIQIPETDQEITLEKIAHIGAESRRTVGAIPVVFSSLEVTYLASEAPMTFPQGCHICELSVDQETGKVEVLRYTVADDFGKLHNPMMCEGQVHGGVVQGIGQALLEQIQYQPDTGELLTTSLKDYCLPRADDVPMLDMQLIEDHPCLTNTMGIKGSGESGAVAAPAAVINAVLDALVPKGVTTIDMPATSEKIWRAMNSVK